MILTNINDYDTINKTIEKLEKTGINIKGIFRFIDSFVSVAARLSEKFCSNIVSAQAIY